MPEPAEAEARRRLVDIRRRALVPHKQRVRLEALEGTEAAGLRRLAAGDKVQQLAAVRLDDDRRGRPFTRDDSDARKGCFGERDVPGAKAERLQCLQELALAMRRREALQEQRRIERHAIELAKTADQPGELALRQRLRAHSPQTLPALTLHELLRRVLSH